MKVILKNYDTGATLGTMSTKRLKTLFDITPVLNEAQMESDILGLGYPCQVVSSGLVEFCEQGFVWSNDMVENALVCHKRGSAQIGGIASITSPDPVRIRKDGQEIELNLRLSITAYEEGYVLNVGKSSANIFGAKTSQYLKNIGTVNVKFAALGSCRVFAGIKALLDYMEKNRGVLQYLAGRGYEFSVEPCCGLFAKDMEDIPSRDKQWVKALNVLLKQINATEETKDSEILSGTASHEEMQAEAISRLQKFGVVDEVVSRFKKNEGLFFSEFGGILYDLNKDAEDAANAVREMGYLPYAIVRNQTESIGDIYLVLYVSADKEAWTYERPDDRGCLMAYGYNATFEEFSELGSAQVQGAIGGLIRLF